MQKYFTLKNIKILYMFVAFVLTFNYYVWFITNNLDPSWIYMLNSTANSGQFIYGRDMVFTYGPLGFLLVTQNIGYNLLCASIFWGIIGLVEVYFLKQIFFEKEFEKFNSNKNILTVSLVMFVLCAFSGMGEFGLNYVLLLILFACLVRYEKIIWYIVAVALTIVGFFLKFNLSVLMLGNLLAFCFINVIFLKRSVWRHLLLTVFVPVGVFVGYLSYNPNIDEFVNYVVGAKNIVDGYIETMSYPVYSQFLLPYTLIALYFVICFIKIKNKWNVICLLMLFCSLFMTYRHGFVRGDHFGGFFRSLMGLSSIFLLFASDTDSKEINIRECFKNIMIIFVASSILGIDFGLFSRARQTNFYEKFMSDKCDKREYFLPETFCKLIGKKKFSVYPWEIAMVKDFSNFVPLYSVQAYSQYTHYLDERQADIFSKSGGVEYIITNTDTIDNRFPLIENPATWKIMATKYDIVNSTERKTRKDGKEFLLRKNENKSYEYCGDELVIEKNAEKEYELPQTKEHLFMTVKSKMNWRGYYAKVFYKIPEVNMLIQFDDGTEVKKRVLMDNLKNETIINRIILNDNEFEQFYNGTMERKVKKIRLTGKGTKYYKDVEVKVRPFKIVNK